jgi:eukaryotic-like serine/threonine-protein kinase
VAALNHPNIAVLYEVGESEGQVFLAMEYLEGSNLREALTMVKVLVKAPKMVQ